MAFACHGIEVQNMKKRVATMRTLGMFTRMPKRGGMRRRLFLKCVECHTKLDSSNKGEIASDFVNASQCFKKDNNPEYPICLKRAIDIFLDMGRFSNSARYEKEIAEWYEEQGNYPEAMIHFSNAADHYNNCESASAANSCKIKVAGFASLQGDYATAIPLFEQVATESLSNPMTKWGARDNFLRAGMCRLAVGDSVSARRALDRYRDQDMSFGSCREGQLLQAILDAYDEQALHQLQTVLSEYDSISPLDQWKITVCVQIKRALEGAENIM